MLSRYIGLGVRLLVLSLLLVLLFNGGMFFGMSGGVQYKKWWGKEQSRKWCEQVEDQRRPLLCCLCTCLSLCKENILNFSTSLMKLKVDWSPVTDTVRRHRPLAWRGENNHKFSKSTLYQDSERAGQSSLGKINMFLPEETSARASTADYSKLVDYSELLRQACNALAPSFCSALLPIPTLTSRPSFQSNGILIFFFLFQNCVNGWAGHFEVSEVCKLLCAFETQAMNLGTCFLKIFIYKFSSASGSLSMWQSK